MPPRPVPLPPLHLVPSEDVDVDALYRAHALTVERWARRFGGPDVDADDIVQEVFLLAKRRLRHWEPGAKVTTWLFRATEKIARRARRRWRMRDVFVRAFGLNTTTTMPSRPSPLDQLIRDDACRRVYAIFDQMSERQRKVLILFELEGLSTEEIAALIAAPQSTVRVWLFRARARFAELAHRWREEAGESS